MRPRESAARIATVDKLLRGVTALAVIAWLGGCGAGSYGNDYPRDWPAPLPGAEGSTTCADLSGRYAVGDGVLAAVFDRPRGAEDHGIYWHTMQVVDEGAQGLTLVFLGSRLGSDPGEPPERRSSSLGSARCQDGWAKWRLARDAGEPLEREPDDHRAVDRYLLIARDADGNLIAQEVIERYETVSLWAPGGADVRVPFTGSLERRWSRWLATTEDAERSRANPLAEDASPRLQKLGRSLPPDVEILSRRADGDGHVLELRLSDIGKLTALQERLLESSDFGDAKLTLTRRLPGGGVVATLRIGQE